MDKWPEIVIQLLTWAGPPELGIAKQRLGYTKKTVASLKKHIIYPNYSWHIADDGSPSWYQDRIRDIMKGEKYTFTDTKKGWDINNNWNTGMRECFKRTDIVIGWPDDRFLEKDIHIEPCVQLLTEYDDVCFIRLTGQEPRLEGQLVDRVDAQWRFLDKKSKCVHVFLCFCFIIHKRWIDHYGYFETDIWPLDKAENIIDRHFRNSPGPGAVVPEALWKGFIPWGGYSTWEKVGGGAFRKDPPSMEERRQGID